MIHRQSGSNGNISQGKTHCKDCLELDGCWFAKNLSPKAPLHPYCHCVKMPISYSKVIDCADAQSAYSKFDPYLFDVKHEYGHGKNKAFESWGYTVGDAKWLQEEIEEQALCKYSSGNYSFPNNSFFLPLEVFLSLSIRNISQQRKKLIFHKLP